MSLNINWTNDSARTWAMNYYEDNPGAQGRMVHLPQNTLIPQTGMTSMTMSIFLQDAENMGDMYCTWITQMPDTSYFWFATRTLQPLNVIHMGYAPYWQIATGTTANPPHFAITGSSGPGLDSGWRTVVGDPAQTYYLNNASDQLPAGLQIEINPTAGGSDLSLDITMSDA